MCWKKSLCILRKGQVQHNFGMFKFYIYSVYMCVHKQPSLHYCNSCLHVVENSTFLKMKNWVKIDGNKARRSKWAVKGSLQIWKKEAGDRKKNIYLLMSWSVSSVSDQLSKSRQCVRMSLLQSTVHTGICEWKCVIKHKKGYGQRERQEQQTSF